MNLAVSERIVLHNKSGRCVLPDGLIASWIQAGVKYVGVVGAHASLLEDQVDDLCIGDGSTSYFMLTAAHGPDETLEDAVSLANVLDGYRGAVCVVEV